MTSNNEKEIAERIKNKYIPKVKEQTKIEELKSLDKKVRKPALIFAYVYGVLGSLILGTGMSLLIVNTTISAITLALGLCVGLIGIAMVATTYPIYQKILASRKSKYSNEIIAKSNELLND